MKYFVVALCLALAHAQFDGSGIESIIVSKWTREIPPPPPVGEVARMARYIVHYSDYTSIGHISRQNATYGYPSSRIYSMSDGLLGQSTGTPYIYTSFFDATPRDLKEDPKCSMSASLVETPYCKQKNFDPQDPRCAQVILTGTFIFLKNDTQEWDFAKKVLFTRHPVMATWPEDHHFFFAKLNISFVQIVDYFGGSKYPTVDEYYRAAPSERILLSKSTVEVILS